MDANRAVDVRGAVIGMLKPYAATIRSITAGNGSGVVEHKAIADELKINFYLAHPYSSWERGLNENFNGLLRQYISKGLDLDQSSDVKDAFRREFVRLYDNVYWCNVRVFKSAIDIVESIMAPVKFIVTNKRSYPTKRIYDRFQLSDYFDGFVCSDSECYQSSNKTDLLRKFIDHNDFNHGSGIYIGDTIGDELAAESVGFDYLNLSLGLPDYYKPVKNEKSGKRSN